MQLSVAKTLDTTSGVLAWQLLVALTVIGPGVERMAGAVVSETFNVTVATELLPDASVTVTAMVL